MAKSFYIRSDDNEVNKVEKRRKLFEQLRTNNFTSLYQTPFDVEIVGKKNIENLIGSISLPLAITGPLTIDSPIFDKDEQVIIPLATTEGALVASISRGIKVLNSSKVVIESKKIGMTRAPAYQLPNHQQALGFEQWILKNKKKIAQVTEQTSSHLKFLSLKTWVKENFVFVRFVFDTDQAMGMNMVTIALQYLYDQLISKKTDAQMVTVSSNLCTDKKQSQINMKLGRGYWVEARVEVKNQVIKTVLKTTPDQIINTYHVKSELGSTLAGSTYSNMQVANVVAALFIATGQDVAHIVEASQANTLVSKTRNGLIFKLIMPDLPIGVIGGGNQLPGQQICKDLIRKNKILTSQQLAEVIAATSLAGEISGLAALSNNTLSQAHQQLGR